MARWCVARAIRRRAGPPVSDDGLYDAHAAVLETVVGRWEIERDPRRTGPAPAARTGGGTVTMDSLHCQVETTQAILDRDAGN